MVLPRWPIFHSIPSNIIKNVEGVYVDGQAGDELLFSKHLPGAGFELHIAKLNSEESVKIASFANNDDEIQQMIVSSAGTYYLLTTKGRLFIWGNNDFGQVGNGDTSKAIVKEPFLPSSLPDFNGAKIVQIAAGSSHSVALTENGQIFMWGSNEFGQIGTGPVISYKLSPANQDMVRGKRFVKIACCSATTLALDSDGHLYGWGNNDGNHQVLGNDTMTLSKYAIRISDHASLKDVFLKDITCGSGYVLALSTTGHLYAWGANEHGQLGLGREQPCVPNPTRVESFDNPSNRVESLVTHVRKAMSAARTAAGDVFVWGETRFGNLSKPKKVAGIDPAIVFCEWMKDPVVTPVLLKIDAEIQSSCQTHSWLQKAFNDAETADMQIVVQGRPIHVHRGLLMARSVVFQKMLSSDMKEGKSGQVEISHFSYDVFFAFLRYLYIGDLEIPESMIPGQLLSLYDLANSYFEENLKKLVSDYFLKKWLNLESVLDTYALTKENGMTHVADAALTIILENLSTLVESEAFDKLSPEHTKTILRMTAKLKLLKN